MNSQWQACLRMTLVIASALALPMSSFAQIKVIHSGGFAAPLQELLPEFERATGIKVTTASGPSQGGGPNTIGAQLRRGVSADVVIMSREGLNELIAEGRILTNTDVDLAETPLGLAVRKGLPSPDIRTVDAFKQTLLQAKSITFPGSTTGIYMTTKLFPQLGIDKVLSGKLRITDVAVPSGESEIAIQPVSELLRAPEFTLVGPIPSEIQYVSVFTAAMVAGAKEPEASKRLISFLASEEAKTAIRRSGMEPSK